MSDARVVAALLATLASIATAQAEPSVTILPLGFAASHFRAPDSEVATAVATSGSARESGLPTDQPFAVVWGETGGAAIALSGGVAKVYPLPSSALAGVALVEMPRGALSASRRVRVGALTAHLSEPTTVYAHEALGPGAHAGSVTIAERQAVAMRSEPTAVPVKSAKVAAGDGAVFEDREVRFAELDGGPAILVVKSYLDRGSVLAVIGRAGGAEWRIIAETPPIGTPQRWLNPAAVADFDGRGKPQIAVVRTPHRDGVLQVWSFDKGALSLRFEAPGYANHGFGSAAQDLAAAIDIDGDGVPELAIPTLDRSQIAILSLKDGIRERARIALPAPALTGLGVIGRGRDAHVLVGLADGRVADIRL